MSDIENNASTGISLADIAGIDFSDIAEIKGGSLPKMMGIFECKSAVLGEREKDGETKYGVQFAFEVLEVTVCLDKDTDPANLVGRKHMEFRNIDPADPATGVGYLKGFVSDLGIDSTGNLGGLPEEAQPGDYTPGFLDACVGLRISAKIDPYKDKNGQDRVKFIPVKQK